MPQLDISTFSSQLFWLVVVFAAFYVVMSMGVVPRIRSVLEKRQNHIFHDLDVAERAKKDAEQIRREYEAELANAREESNQTLQAALKGIDDMVRTEQEGLTRRLDKLVGDAESKITVKKTEALASSHETISALVTEMAGTIGGVKPKAAQLQAAIARAVKE